ncbi:SDR family NAD(P)-dependent oxidoreductase [Ferviditalea candida]|uniref:SDR family oxidoreductase n=1 Tax=Ferviditalea candida TaxID=3108399 RepID=A0ABU5ZFU3_9BACL|nr:SDR family oxidoreductase [Paenibacillaceae bacterium T2]
MGNMFKDKVVLVTGSGQGVGRAIALAFAAEGAKVVTNNRKPGSTRFLTMTEAEYNALSPEKKKEFDDITARLTGDAESTAKTIRDMGGEALPIYCDISKMDEVEKMVDKIIETYGTIHILVNVAGGFGGGPMEKMTEQQYDRINNIKPKGYFNVMRCVLPYMLKQHYGRIINSTSKAFMGDIIKHTEYSTANAGVVGLTQGAACEFFHQGITVNAFGPWARTRAAYEGAFSILGDERMIPGQRAFPKADATPDPEAVCPFILYLASDHAKDVTGTVFTLAGNEIGMHQFPSPSLSASPAKNIGQWTS